MRRDESERITETWLQRGNEPVFQGSGDIWGAVRRLGDHLLRSYPEELFASKTEEVLGDAF